MRVSFVAFAFVSSLFAADPSQSAVQVTQTHDRLIDMGSGTVVRSSESRSLVLTNRHVVPTAAGKIEVHHKGRAIRAKWLGVDDRADLALLEVAEKLPAVALAEDEPAKDAPLRTWGFPGGKLVPKVGRAIGNLWNARQGDAKVYYSSIHPEPGDSGCGLFNSDGCLVAINWGGNTDANCVCLADIKRFLGKR